MKSRPSLASSLRLSAASALGALSVIVFCATAANSSAAVIWTNPITGTNPNTSNPYTTGQTFDANITVSGIGRGAGAAGTNANNRYNANSWSTTSLDPTAYFTFTLDANSGYEIDFTDFVYASQASIPLGFAFAFRSSLDGFTADIGTPDHDGTTISLAGAAFQNLTDSIEFRLYAWGASGGSTTFSINDFTFNGSVNAVLAEAAKIYWDTNGVTSGVGGSGTWDYASTSFSSATAGTDPAARVVKTDPVIFAGTAGTVTVSGTVEADGGITFETTGYQLTGGTALELGGATNAITTATGVTSTIDTTITGTGGLNKAGDGTLVLGGTNSFTGNVGPNAGTLSISSNGNLGDAANDLVFGGGTLAATSSLTLGAARSVSGSSGTLKVGSGNTLTIDGTVALTGTLTLSDAGTVSLSNVADTTLGGLVFTTSGTLETTGGGLIVSGNLTANGSSGTATIDAPLTLSATSTTVTVASGGTLELSQGVDLSNSGSSRLITGGPGTLVLGGAMTSTNAASGLRIGTSAASPTNGGTVQIASAAALGTGQLQHNYGTLHASSALSITQGISIGGREGAAATFDGADINVTGTIAMFDAGGATGDHRINVNNNTTFSSAFSNTAVESGAVLKIGGTGTLTLAAANASLTDPITLVDTVTLSTTSAGTIGGDVTVSSGAKLAGSGSVGTVLVQSGGNFAAGNSIGTMTVTGDLDLDGGSNFEWELDSETVGTRGTDYDAVDVTGGLEVTGSVFKIIVNGLNIAGAFWDAGHTWDVFDNGATGNFASFALYDSSDLDNAVDYGSEGSFTFTSVDGDLKWTAIPEPTSALAGLLLGAGLLRRRRRP